MKLACPHCKDGALRTVETRSTAQMVFRTRVCTACAARTITCETVFTDGFIPKTVRRALPEAA